MPLHKLTAEFVINTPLFMSGADQEKAELRVSSIKGAIRFWWRALNYSRFNGDIISMKDEEDEIFGSTRGQSQVLFSLAPTNALEVENSHLNGSRDNAKEYLGMRYLGYGVMDSTSGKLVTVQGNLEKSHSYIKSKQKFILKVISKTSFDDSFIGALKLFGLIGNLGSKSRKGYGSITLLSLEGGISEPWHCPDNYDAYSNEILKLLTSTQHHTELPEITAFYNESEVYYLEESSANGLLNHYGLMMMRYRSAGKSDPNNPELRAIRNYADWDHNTGTHRALFDSEKRFWNDHDWAKGEANNESIEDFNTFHPERIVFGLPQNYDRQDRSYVKPQEYERRSSPLFFHVHQLGNGKYAGIALIMKSVFLPDNDGEEINADGNPVVLNIDASYSKLSDFLTAHIRHEPNVNSDEAYFPDLQRIRLQANPQTQEEE